METQKPEDGAPEKQEYSKRRQAYPLEFRKKALDFLESGHTPTQTAKVFGVTGRTINNWKRRQQAGNLEALRHAYPLKIAISILKEYLAYSPYITPKDIMEVFGVRHSTALRYLKRLELRGYAVPASSQ